MSTSKSILRILLVYKVKYVQNVLGYGLLKEEIALRTSGKGEKTTFPIMPRIRKEVRLNTSRDSL